MRTRKIKWLSSIIIIISMMTLVIIIIIKLISNFSREVIIEYVRRRPLKMHAYCWYPVSKEYEWANFANVRKIIFLKIEKGIYRIKIETYDPIPIKTKDLLSFTVFFDTPLVEGIWDTGVIYANANYPFSSTPPSPNGGVFRIRGSKLYWIGGIRASIKGSVVIIDFASKLINNTKEPIMLVVYYLPANIKLPKGWSVWATVDCDVLRIDPELEKGQIMIPPQP